MITPLSAATDGLISGRTPLSVATRGLLGAVAIEIPEVEPISAGGFGYVEPVERRKRKRIYEYESPGVAVRIYVVDLVEFNPEPEVFGLSDSDYEFKPRLLSADASAAIAVRVALQSEASFLRSIDAGAAISISAAGEHEFDPEIKRIIEDDEDIISILMSLI